MADDLPESLVRELCAGWIAETAWLGDPAERDALLRVSYRLSPDPKERAWEPASAADFTIAIRKLRGAIDGGDLLGFNRKPHRFVLDAFEAGLELLQRESPS